VSIERGSAGGARIVLRLPPRPPAPLPDGA
jgi:hypothetical protein